MKINKIMHALANTRNKPQTKPMMDLSILQILFELHKIHKHNLKNADDYIVIIIIIGFSSFEMSTIEPHFI